VTLTKKLTDHCLSGFKTPKKNKIAAWWCWGVGLLQQIAWHGCGRACRGGLRRLCGGLLPCFPWFGPAGRCRDRVSGLRALVSRSARLHALECPAPARVSAGCGFGVREQQLSVVGHNLLILPVCLLLYDSLFNCPYIFLFLSITPEAEMATQKQPAGED